MFPTNNILKISENFTLKNPIFNWAHFAGNVTSKVDRADLLVTLQTKCTWEKYPFLLKNLVYYTFPKMTGNILNFDHHSLTN